MWAEVHSKENRGSGRHLIPDEEPSASCHRLSGFRCRPADKDTNCNQKREEELITQERQLFVPSLHLQSPCLNSTVDLTQVLRINLPAIIALFTALFVIMSTQDKGKEKRNFSVNGVNDTSGGAAPPRPALCSAVHCCILKRDGITQKRM